jgi:FAD/FMN-containing dehydrogenase
LNRDVPDPLLLRLAGIVGPDHLLTDPDMTSGYGSDWTGRFRGSPRFVVRPADTAEVAAVVAECGAAGIPVVPQGGNTSLVGGATPLHGEAVLSLGRLSEIGAVDPAGQEVLAGAGATLAALQDAARPHGLRFGVDLASRDSATVGGMAATNAGGIHVLRHGMMRAQVAGMEAVLADGSVISRLTGAGKDNTGYDLPNLLAGSEGTLGVITRLRLRLVPDPSDRAVALLGLRSVADALSLVGAARAALPGLEAAEAFFQDGLELVCAHAGVAPPWPEAHAVYVLVESAGTGDQLSPLAEFLAERPEVGLAAAVAAEARDRERLWAYRERHTEAVNAAGVPHKLDVAVPLAALEEFLARANETVSTVEPNARVVTFGHLAEGNLHVNILGLEPEDERADEAILRLVADLGGSISAEHGIGVAKRRFLHLTRSAADIAAMRALKAALDPRGILNPGVIFP